MKIISKLSAIFLSLLLLCSCSKQDFLKYRLSIQDSIMSEEDRVMNNVTELIKQKDTDAIIDMFSAHAVENGTSEIEENLKLLEEFLGSEFETDSYAGYGDGRTIPSYYFADKTLKVYKEEKLFYLTVVFVTRNEEDADDIGVHRIDICSEENWGTLNKEIAADPERQYGVYIDELIFEDEGESENEAQNEAQDEAVSEPQTPEH